MCYEHIVDRPAARHCEYICAIGESCNDTYTKVLRPEIGIESRIAEEHILGCQKIPHNWIVIKVASASVLKQIAGSVESRWNLLLPH